MTIHFTITCLVQFHLVWFSTTLFKGLTTQKDKSVINYLPSIPNPNPNPQNTNEDLFVEI